MPTFARIGLIALVLSLPASALADDPHPTPSQPLPQDLSDGLHSLNVEGFSPALFSPPQDTQSPRPVVVFLHGIQADVEEQCNQWREAVRTHGWLLCIRGQRSKRWSRRHNLWTHTNGRVAEREIQAALHTLHTRFPHHVSLQHTVLAGYSRGAILAPRIALNASHPFAYLILAEGGLDQLRAVTPQALARRGVRGVVFAMGTYIRRSRMQTVLSSLKKSPLRGVFVDMPKAGHRIGPHFHRTGAEALRTITDSNAPQTSIITPNSNQNSP